MCYLFVRTRYLEPYLLALMCYVSVRSRYLEPYLLDGHKFDLRLYVLLASVNPLKGYLCRTGMVRKAMEPYQKPNPSVPSSPLS